MRIMIPNSEFKKRIKNVQESMAKNGYDFIMAFGNEAEPQFVRYLSDYWPSFESAGVLVPAKGKPLLLIGPESLTYAVERSRIPDIRKLKAFRESSDPEYPGIVLDTFDSVIEETLVGGKPRKFGVAGFSLMNTYVYQELSRALDKYELKPEKADHIIMNLRMIKSENELNCLREAARITKAAFDHVLVNIRPGMTETNVVGLALAKMHEEGCEREAYPLWVLCGEGSNQAISRPRNNTIKKNEIIQIQIGARYEGYASSIGRPVVIGKADQAAKELIKAGYIGQEKVIKTLRAGMQASEVARAYLKEMERIGYLDHVLYGPCHGNGLMEGEAPWIEKDSKWTLEENMTFCVDIFLGNSETRRGIRIEDTVCIGKDGVEEMTNYRKDILELTL